MLKLFFKNKNNFTSNFFQKNVEYIETNFDECDFVINGCLPIGIIDVQKINEIIKNNIVCGKKNITFLISDCEQEIIIPDDLLLFRTSTNKKMIKKNEFVLPHIISLDVNFKLNPLNKGKLPIIGFCGYFVKDFTKRKITCEIFKNSKNFDTNFIIRDKFWGGKPGDINLINDFKNNIINSHFTICNRGVGNFSMRFYEVLSMGRIPILVDDNTILPFENEINWGDYIFIEKTPESLYKSVLDYWNSSSEKEIMERQNKCYDLFVNNLSAQSYGKKIENLLVIKLKK